MLLSKEFLEAYDPVGPMEVTLGLVNWPEKGLTLGNLWTLSKPQPLGMLREIFGKGSASRGPY